MEDESKGKNRAEYAGSVLKILSTSLTQDFGRGYSVDNLEFMRKYYLAYQKSETVSRKLSSPLSWSHYEQLLKIKDPDERNFYEIEASQNHWSVRELTL